jgi:hypothetical protein
MVRVLDSISTHARAGAELLVTFDGGAPFRRSRTGDALELALGSGLLRYPRLRFADAALYPETLHSSLCGVNAVAQLQGAGTPALAHLRVC